MGPEAVELEERVLRALVKRYTGADCYRMELVEYGSTVVSAIGTYAFHGNEFTTKFTFLVDTPRMVANGKRPRVFRLPSSYMAEREAEILRMKVNEL